MRRVGAKDLVESLPDSLRATRGSSPPRWLFHGGPKEQLEKNVQRGSISDRDWSQHIMNGDSMWSLPSWRKGFYGSKNPLSALVYGDFAADGGERPWLIAFKLRDGSRKPPRALSYAFGTLESKRFSSWLEKNAHRFGNASAAELIARLQASGDVDEDGRFLSLPRGDLGEKVKKTPNERLAEQILDAYLHDQQAHVVEDSQENWSWYVRQRDAIEEIVGEPAELLSIMSAPSFWKFEAGEKGLPSLVLIAAQVLAELPDVDDRALAKLKASVRAAFPKRPFGFDEILIGHYKAVLRIVDLYAELRDRSQHGAFEKALSDFMARSLRGHVKKLTQADLFAPLIDSLERAAKR